MAASSLDCLTQATAQPNSTVLANIEACQLAGGTPYCYPPNGTRICVPSTNIPFYWPTSHYRSNAKIAIAYDPTFATPRYNNSGFTTRSFSSLVYDKAILNPDNQDEAVLKMYFYESLTDDVRDAEIYEGPTLILVNLTARPTTTATRAPTVTARFRFGVDSDDEDDGGPNLGAGTIVGIVFGSIIGLAAVIAICCRRCCCGKGRGNSDQRKEEPYTVNHEAEWREQSGVMSARSGADELQIMEAAKVAQRKDEVDIKDLDGPPPKYTP